MAKTKSKRGGNGTRAAAKEQAQFRRVYDLEDMPDETDVNDPSVPGMRVKGVKYRFATANDLSGPDLAEIRRIDTLNQSRGEEPETLEKATEVAEMFVTLTRLILIGLPDDVLDSLTIAQHQYISECFTEYTNANSEAMAAAMAAPEPETAE